MIQSFCTLPYWETDWFTAWQAAQRFSLGFQEKKTKQNKANTLFKHVFNSVPELLLRPEPFMALWTLEGSSRLTLNKSFTPWLLIHRPSICTSDKQ